MFIAGVVIGPALALVLADFLFKPGSLAPRWIAAAVVLLLLVIAFLPFLVTELKIGLVVGLPLGLLLAGTPSHRAAEETTLGAR